MSDAGVNPAVAAEFVLQARGVAKDYFDGERVLRVLRDVNIQVRPGEIISVVGASGVGKSTLLHLLGALDRPTGGGVHINGQNVSTLPDRDLASVRASSVGFIFQFHHLLSEFSALENVIVPGLILRRPMNQLLAEASALLDSVGLGERLSHRPSKLSGGEQQRVALARALINNPDIILADEPTGNLDTETADVVIDLLWNNTRNKGKSLVIVTHEPDIAARADRCLRLRDGVLIPA